MNYFKKYPFYPFLVVLFFCLHGTAENVGFISCREVIEVFIVVAIFVTTAFALLYLLTKSTSCAGFITFLLASIYLFFGAIKALLVNIPFLNTYTFFLPLIFISVLLIIFLVRRKTFLLTKITYFLNILFIVYCIFDLFTIVRKQIKLSSSTYTSTIFFDAKKVQEKPNLYFLLFDEYAGYSSLNDSFNFKNDIFYEQLRKDSFEQLPIHSNYSITQFSIASIFSMNYIEGLKDSSTVSWQQTQQRMREIKYAEVFDVFKNMDYDVKTFSLFEVGENKAAGANQYLLGHKRVLTNKMLHNVLLKDIGWKLAVGKNASTWMQKILLDDMPVYNKKIEAGLLSCISNKQKLQFVYAHFLMPHFPFLFDSNGVSKPLASQFEAEPWFNKTAYISYLKYCNKKIIEYEQAITKKDSSAIIILMSDHGFRDLRVNLKPSAFNNFCAIKKLQHPLKPLSSEMSNVNFFKFLFNQYYNQQIKYGKDSTILLKEAP